VFGPPGAPDSVLSLAHGCSPAALLAAMRRSCAPSGQVTLHLVRRLLRPAHRPDLTGLGWCDKLQKRPDDMTPVNENVFFLSERAGGGFSPLRHAW
jgi:hypothetical protein